MKGNEPVEGKTRTAIDHLIDIFKNASKPGRTEVDEHRQRISDAAAMRTVSEENKVDGTWIEPDEFNLKNDDLRTTENVDIVHSTSDKGPHLIEEERPVTRVTRASRRLKLITAVDISGSCSTA